MASFQDLLQQIFRAAHFPVEAYAPPHWSITPEIIGELRVLPYVDQWRRALENKWFHIKLEDQSIFVFDQTTGEPSYNFIHSPIAADTFRAFLLTKKLDYTTRNRATYAEEYTLLIETAPLRENVTPIRYDVDSLAYKPGSHPMAHLHIGLDNPIRIALRRQMSPTAFSLFVMRQMYPESWVRLLTHSDQFKLRRILRDNLKLVQAAYWQPQDEFELNLN